ncbi:hypothetical protein M422DRAFT_185668, partial [Sphaerobolus stellatus SS14]
INVYFHVIAKDTTIAGGYVPDSRILAQMSVLNATFAGTGLTFALARTTRTINQTWFNNVFPENVYQTEMKRSLRQGGAADLNIYTVGLPFPLEGGFRLLGYATFPFSYQSSPQDDGIVLNVDILPGGPFPGLDRGKTLTHEVGHWVGLYHTFQGGCSAPGDMVSDTPPESSAAFGCPNGRDTCFNGGVDPIHNYMDYTDDICRTQFTPGQIARLQSQMATYRGKLVTN